MRSDRTTQDDRIFAVGGARYTRVDILDTGGTWRDLTNQRGYNFVDKCDWKSDHDTQIASASIEVRREIFKLSLAPDVAGSLLNQLGGGSQLFQQNRRIRIYSQLQPSGVQPSDSKWSLVFDGVIDKVDSGKDPISLECSDLLRRLDKRYIKHERAYGVWQPGQRYIGDATLGAVVAPSASDPTFPNPDPKAPTGPWFRAQNTGYASTLPWLPSHGYSTSNAVAPSIPNGYVYTANAPGTTGSTEPTWPTTPGATVVDNGVTWTCVQPTPPVWPNTLGATVSDAGGITWKCVAVAGGSPLATPLETQIQMVLDDNMGTGAWSLYTPSATSEVVRPYTQSGESVLAAISKLADIIGWDIRYKYDTGTSAFRLTLYDINRTNTTSAYTLAPSSYDPIDSFERDLDLIRNQIEVFYWDGVTTAADGSPQLSSVVVPDATTQSQDPTLYSLAIASQDPNTGNDLLYAAVTEGAGALIGSATAARKMAQAILSDWCTTPLNVGVGIDLAWWFEVGDVITLKADGLHADSDLKLAIWSVEHQTDPDGHAVTKLGLKGRPSTGVLRHMDNLSGPGLNGGPARQLAESATATATATSTIAGASLTWKIPTHARYDSTEVHISTAGANFVPSANTLAGTTRAGRHDIAPGAAGSTQTGTIAPGTTYYIKTAHRSRRVHGNSLLVSPPSSAATVTTGYTNLAHINPNLLQCFRARISSGQTFTTSGPINFNSVDSDPLGLFDATNHYFTFANNGQVLITAVVDFSGVAVGDAAAMTFETWNGSSWQSPLFGTWVNTVNTGAGGKRLQPTLTLATAVTAGQRSRLSVVCTPVTTPFSWLAQSSSVLGDTGTWVQCTQLLQSP